MNKELIDALLGADSGPKDSEGYYDFNTLSKALYSIKPVTNGAAKMLLSQGRIALDKAVALVSSVIRRDPGNEASDILAKSVSRDVNDIGGHFDWHQDHIGKDLNAIYDPGDDLKKYYLLAFRTYNSALQGKKTAESVSYYQEVIKTLAEYITAGRKAANKTVNYLAWGLGVTAVAAVGYGYYKLKMAKYKYGALKMQSENPHLSE